MNLNLIAAIVKKYGVQTLGGKYELFITDSQISTVPPGSALREHRDGARGGFVLMLNEASRTVDITATTTDAHCNPVPSAYHAARPPSSPPIA